MGSRIGTSVWISTLCAAAAWVAACPAGIGQGSSEIGDGKRVVAQMQNRPQAKRVALDRYVMLKRTRLKGYFISSSDGHCEAFFPFGRSDRVYLWFEAHDGFPDLAAGAPATGTRSAKHAHSARSREWVRASHAMYKLVCLQRKGSRVTLAYWIDLKLSREGKPRQGATLLDALKGNGFDLQGRVTPYMLKDLAQKRRYTGYLFYCQMPSLIVSVFPGSHMEDYATMADPLTDKVSKDYFALMERYGLPVSSQELPLFGLPRAPRL